MAEHSHAVDGGPAVLPHVVIVGGGFGGIEAAKILGRAKVQVTLVDRRNHHVFQPLLYQVATAALNPANIASPIRRILRGLANVEVLLGDVESVDVKHKAVKLADGELHYDYLIVATGATHSYFGHEEWSADAPGLEVDRGRSGHPKAGLDGVRGGRARGRHQASTRVDDLRRRRCRSDGGRACGGPGGDRPPRPDQ